MDAEDEIALLVADVFELAGAFRRQGDAIAGEVGQTQARWQLLSVLSDGDWTASDAARRLGVSRQAVQRLADALLAEGLLRADANPGHRRAPLLRLTPTGRRTYDAITRRSLAWRRQVVQGLPAGSLQALRTAVQQVLRSVEG